jgi:integral membrane sensor domain MASE1
MPPRWSRIPTRQDPEYRKLDDRMTFAVHVAGFAAINSGMWFFHIFLQTDWQWLPWVTVSWFGILISHLVYISAIADYSETPKST